MRDRARDGATSSERWPYGNASGFHVKPSLAEDLIAEFQVRNASSSIGASAALAARCRIGKVMVRRATGLAHVAREVSQC